jgi:[acyl-carrier-protein] S-malonyltransferase
VTRALIVFPGRGSYGASELGTLARIARESPEARADVDEITAALDAPRLARGRAPILELDARKTFEPALHLAAENASPLIVACALADARAVARTHEIAGFAGNSLGFYTALGASGVLSLDDLGHLVEAMVTLQSERGAGGQLIHPAPGGAERAAIDAAVLAAGAFLSVDLGAFCVLGGDEAALSRLESTLAPIQQRGRIYPMRLAHHLAFHTPLLRGVSDGALPLATTLSWRAPSAHLLLGNGAIVTPWSADPAAIAAYTLDEQITTTFRFRDALRAGLRELAPDLVILTRPGESIGGSIGAVMAAEGWRGVRGHADLGGKLLSLGRATPEP